MKSNFNIVVKPFYPVKLFLDCISCIAEMKGCLLVTTDGTEVVHPLSICMFIAADRYWCVQKQWHSQRHLNTDARQSYLYSYLHIGN